MINCNWWYCGKSIIGDKTTIGVISGLKTDGVTTNVANACEVCTDETVKGGFKLKELSKEQPQKTRSQHMVVLTFPLI